MSDVTQQPTAAEQKTVMVPIDANYDATIAELNKNGWKVVPGLTPVAIFYLFRMKQPEQKE